MYPQNCSYFSHIWAQQGPPEGPVGQSCLGTQLWFSWCLPYFIHFLNWLWVFSLRWKRLIILTSAICLILLWYCCDTTFFFFVSFAKSSDTEVTVHHRQKVEDASLIYVVLQSQKKSFLDVRDEFLRQQKVRNLKRKKKSTGNTACMPKDAERKWKEMKEKRKWKWKKINRKKRWEENEKENKEGI